MTEIYWFITQRFFDRMWFLCVLFGMHLINKVEKQM